MKERGDGERKVEWEKRRSKRQGRAVGIARGMIDRSGVCVCAWSVRARVCVCVLQRYTSMWSLCGAGTAGWHVHCLSGQKKITDSAVTTTNRRARTHTHAHWLGPMPQITVCASFCHTLDVHTKRIRSDGVINTRRIYFPPSDRRKIQRLPVTHRLDWQPDFFFFFFLHFAFLWLTVFFFLLHSQPYGQSEQAQKTPPKIVGNTGNVEKKKPFAGNRISLVHCFSMLAPATLAISKWCEFSDQRLVYLWAKLV